uniref:Uncharacterized protein n=1 Tax=Utricularia reniformis TaxID=192314 RepID=A0A1Y0B4I8_9LAMI|nr:hypothetical protein AEK19_MT2230 [Utricularia reniformis]ART32376.1 hypothetical protein AEK19_MT2230 [Utricularia reniformis]
MGSQLRPSLSSSFRLGFMQLMSGKRLSYRRVTMF